MFDFPEGIGPVECVNVEHEEVLLVPRWVDCRRVTFKYGLGDEFIDVLQDAAQARARLEGEGPRQGRRGGAARRRRGGATGPGHTRRPHDRQDLRRHARDRASARTASRGRPTSTTSSTTSGRCASTARRRSSGRRPSTPSRRSSCWRPAPGRGGGARTRGVSRAAVPRPARGARRTARPARARALAPRGGASPRSPLRGGQANQGA